MKAKAFSVVELRGNDNYTHAYLTVSIKTGNLFYLTSSQFTWRGSFDANNRFGRGATYKDIRCIGEITLMRKLEARVNFNRDFYTYMNMPCMTLNTKGEGMDITNMWLVSCTLAERICWRRKEIHYSCRYLTCIKRQHKRKSPLRKGKEEVKLPAGKIKSSEMFAYCNTCFA